MTFPEPLLPCDIGKALNFYQPGIDARTNISDIYDSNHPVLPNTSGLPNDLPPWAGKRVYEK